MARVISLQQIAATLEVKGNTIKAGDYLQLKNKESMFYDKASGFKIAADEVQKVPLKMSQKLAAAILAGRFDIVSKDEVKKRKKGGN